MVKASLPATESRRRSVTSTMATSLAVSGTTKLASAPDLQAGLHIADVELQALGPEVTQLISNRERQVMQGRLTADSQHQAIFFGLGLGLQHRHSQASSGQQSGFAKFSTGEPLGFRQGKMFE